MASSGDARDFNASPLVAQIAIFVATAHPGRGERVTRRSPLLGRKVTSQNKLRERFVRREAMQAVELALAAMSLVAAYGGSFVGDYLLDRFGR